MPWGAALTLLNVKPPLLSWKAPTATAISGISSPSVTYAPKGTMPAIRRSQRRAPETVRPARAPVPAPRPAPRAPGRGAGPQGRSGPRGPRSGRGARSRGPRDPPGIPGPRRPLRSGPPLTDHAGPLLGDHVLGRRLLGLTREGDAAGRSGRQRLVGGLIDRAVSHQGR